MLSIILVVVRVLMQRYGIAKALDKFTKLSEPLNDEAAVEIMTFSSLNCLVLSDHLI